MYLLPLTISRRVHVSPVLYSELFLPTLGAQVLLDRGLSSYTGNQQLSGHGGWVWVVGNWRAGVHSGGWGVVGGLGELQPAVLATEDGSFNVTRLLRVFREK